MGTGKGSKPWVWVRDLGLGYWYMSEIWDPGMGTGRSGKNVFFLGR